MGQPNHHLAIDPEREMQDILDIVGDEQITGYQLLDIFDEDKDLAVVKRKLKHTVE